MMKKAGARKSFDTVLPVFVFFYSLFIAKYKLFQWPPILVVA